MAIKIQCMHVSITLVITFLLNLPFGYYRARYKTFSFMWFVLVHAPVPFVIITRYLLDIQMTWELLPLLLASYFLGQFTGKKYYLISKNKG